MLHDAYLFGASACENAWNEMVQECEAGGLERRDLIVEEVRGLDFEHNKDVKNVWKKVNHYWKKVEQQREKDEKAREKKEKEMRKPRYITTH